MGTRTIGEPRNFGLTKQEQEQRAREAHKGILHDMVWGNDADGKEVLYLLLESDD